MPGVLGVDACKAGWYAAKLVREAGFWRLSNIRIYQSFRDVLEDRAVTTGAVVRSLRRYFFGLRVGDFLAFATFMRSRMTSSRVGTGIPWPFGVFCAFSLMI